MELGEVLFALAQSIIQQAEQEMSTQGIPLSMRPIVIDGVKAYFLNAAYDHLVALRIKENSGTPAAASDSKEEN